MAKELEKQEADRLKKEKKVQQLQKKIEAQEKKKEQELKKMKRLREKADREQQKEKVTKKIKRRRKTKPTESEGSDTNDEVLEMMDNGSTSSSIDASTSFLEGEEPVLTDITNVEPTTPKKKDKHICVNDWVMVLYDGVEYPGCVVSIDETDYEIETLESVMYFRKQMWR